jgi:predicted metal-dependent HD superfamily phosphohydrolase
MVALSVENFQLAVTRVGGGQADDTHALLMAAWSEPHRRYHQLQHLEEGVTLAGQWGGRLGPFWRGLLVLGYWFHDAVYDPRGTDNELRSAELARVELAKLGVPTPAQDRVAALVMATAHGSTAQATSGDFLADLLVDIDLAIMGASPERFAQYEAQVRDEYGFVDDEAYAIGRGKVMGHFSELAFGDPSTLYRTGYGRTLLAPARVNLAKYRH